MDYYTSIYSKFECTKDESTWLISILKLLSDDMIFPSSKQFTEKAYKAKLEDSEYEIVYILARNVPKENRAEYKEDLMEICRDEVFVEAEYFNDDMQACVEVDEAGKTYIKLTSECSESDIGHVSRLLHYFCKKFNRPHLAVQYITTSSRAYPSNGGFIIVNLKDVEPTVIDFNEFLELLNSRNGISTSDTQAEMLSDSWLSALLIAFRSKEI
jgi:hypothetical protein